MFLCSNLPGHFRSLHVKAEHCCIGVTTYPWPPTSPLPRVMLAHCHTALLFCKEVRRDKKGKKKELGGQVDLKENLGVLVFSMRI